MARSNLDSQERMHLLGVTWVIISMKILYGLAISMYTWDWIGEPNWALITWFGYSQYCIAQYHDEDAIATQATLVLLAIGSAAGGPYGEEGVAIMIGIGTLLFHGLAYLRSSGNLASLGLQYLICGLVFMQSVMIGLSLELKLNRSMMNYFCSC